MRPSATSATMPQASKQSAERAVRRIAVVAIAAMLSRTLRPIKAATSGQVDQLFTRSRFSRLHDPAHVITRFPRGRHPSILEHRSLAGVVGGKGERKV